MANKLFNMLTPEQRNKAVKLIADVQQLMELQQTIIEPNGRLSNLRAEINQHGRTGITVCISTNCVGAFGVDIVYRGSWLSSSEEYHTAEQFLALMKESEIV